jgi:hypothetical protein
MYNHINMPVYKIVFYANNSQTGYYTKTQEQPSKTPVMRLPYELKVEPTQLHQIKCNATLVIRGKEKLKKGNFKFFTGLQPTVYEQWFSGNDYEFIHSQKVQSLCLFHFTMNNGRLTVFYFSRFYIDNPAARERFINDAIQVLLKRHFIG